MEFKNHYYLIILATIVAGILLLLLLLYRFTPSHTFLTSSAAPTASQSVSGDCSLRQNTHHTRVQCAGNFTFKAKSANGNNIAADVSGHNNRINVRSVGNDSSAHTNKIVISQSGNGSSVRITFDDTLESSHFDQQWTLHN